MWTSKPSSSASRPRQRSRPGERPGRARPRRPAPAGTRGRPGRATPRPARMSVSTMSAPCPSRSGWKSPVARYRRSRAPNRSAARDRSPWLERQQAERAVGVPREVARLGALADLDGPRCPVAARGRVAGDRVDQGLHRERVAGDGRLAGVLGQAQRLGGVGGRLRQVARAAADVGPHRERPRQQRRRAVLPRGGDHRVEPGERLGVALAEVQRDQVPDRPDEPEGLALGRLPSQLGGDAARRAPAGCPSRSR